MLPIWVNYIIAGMTVVVLFMLFEVYASLKKKVHVMCVIPDRIRKNALIPVIGSMSMTLGGVLEIVFSITGNQIFRDISAVFLDFFYLTILHFVYSLRSNIKKVT